MKHKKRLLCVIIGLNMLLMFLQVGVHGDVTISHLIDKSENVVYVAGNDDFYPIEYYNEKTNRYEGVMPKLLEDISNNSGINFAYVKNGSTQTEKAQNLQAEIVSACVSGTGSEYISKSVPAFSFEKDGEVIQICWGFTTIADEKLVNTIAEHSGKISQQKINGYLLSAGLEVKKSGNFVWVLIGAAALGVIVGTALMIRKSKKTIYNSKTTDSETGMGNLIYFRDCFDKLISNDNHSLYYIAYITIDSNYLQMYHGESVFKNAIIFTKNTLKSYVSDKQFAAKISDNGFAFVFWAMNQNSAKGIIEEIIKKLNAYADTMENNEKNCFCAAMYNLHTKDKNSDVLLYNLRKKCNEIMNTDCQIVYCDSSVMNSITEEKELYESILQGLKNSEFKLHVQFVVDNKTKKIVSCEALSRWYSPDKGMLFPGKYLVAIEKSGHISKLDYYMFEACCRQLHLWENTEFRDISLSCNITRSTLSESDFLTKIKKIMEQYNFQRKKLYIEITEEIIEKSFERATENVRACKELGLGISLDDIGTGYTSLKNLCDYPIDIVKIDREILLKTDTHNGEGLFRGIIALAHSLNMRVICEGVETEEHKNFVDKTDCDMVQGWYYSHVFPVREGEEFAKKYL